MTQAPQLRLVGGESERHGDAEIVVIEHDDQEAAPFVDPPERKLSLLERIEATEYVPLVAPWLRSKQSRREAVKQYLRHVLYVLLKHLLRTHLYAGRVVLWSPLGAWRAGNNLLRWVAGDDDGGYHLRQAAARLNEPDTYLHLKKQQRKDFSFRGPLAAVIAFVLVVAVAVVWVLVSPWALAPVPVVALVWLAWMGRPEDKQLVERVVAGKKFTRLTAEMVRDALCACGVSGLTDPAKITFPPPGIHRDGPGWLARVNLPAGIEAVSVMERRGKLSSALQLPVDQVWPSAGPDHAGQLDLWVGYQPASKMGAPQWSLAAPTARTSVFEPFDFAFDARCRAVKATLFERNFLVGGVPGSGKSYGVRTLAIGAALDPFAELKIAEFKGVADFADLGEFASSYVCGVDDAALEEGGEIVYWALAEAERRGRRIRKARERGEAPLGKVTPELAYRPGSGLHPIVIVIDEAHELLTDKEVAKALERLIKRGRALCMIVLLATQVADRDSVPPIITRCVNMRWGMAVPDHIANDQIMGTGAHKSGLTGTVYRPEIDAGWGVLKGLPIPTPARSQFPNQEMTDLIMARVRQLRGGTVVGGRQDAANRRNLIADLRACVRPGENGVHWDVAADRLAELDGSYEGATGEIISAQARAKGVPSKDTRMGAKSRVLKGARAEDLVALLSGTGEV